LTGGAQSREVPFRVYAAIATAAIAAAREDGDSREGNVREHFKRRCAVQGLPYDNSIVQRATEAALVAHHKQHFETLRARVLAAPRSSTSRLRRERRSGA
jgi:hypothetical protein